MVRMKSGELRARKQTPSFCGSAGSVCLGFLLLGCWATETGGSTLPGLVSTGESVIRDQINVLLIGVDTLRADRVECYGYKNVRTPHINRLAEDGVLFRNAVVQVPLTLPSFCSIMTGTYPMYHGVRDFSYGSLRQDKTTWPNCSRDVAMLRVLLSVHLSWMPVSDWIRDLTITTGDST